MHFRKLFIEGVACCHLLHFGEHWIEANSLLLYIEVVIEISKIADR